MLLKTEKSLFSFHLASSIKVKNMHIRSQEQMNGSEEIKCRELANSSSFYHRVYSEIEEIGWEHLVCSSEDLMFLSFRTLDGMERMHVLELQMDKTYPKCPPSISADIPHIPKIDWSTNSRLKDVVIQFQKHLEKLQEFWSTLDEIDKSLWIVGPSLPCRAMCNRLVNVGNGCSIMISITVDDPRSLPECRFVGGDSSMISSLSQSWFRNSKKWIKEKPFKDNLACILGFQLPKVPSIEKTDNQVECGICYAQHLPVENELGGIIDCRTDYTCENANCRRAFHSVCLADWLQSITTTRKSFNVLFGTCPYCLDPIAVRLKQ